MGKLEISKNTLPVTLYAERNTPSIILSKEESEQLLKATMFSSMIDELKIDNQISPSNASTFKVSEADDDIG
jgi:nucleoid DNA-binding protein